MTASVAGVELEYLATCLAPPCQLGEFTLTGVLARSDSSLVFAARRDSRSRSQPVALKVTGTLFAPALGHELDLLRACADADVPGIVRPLTSELVWLFAAGDRPLVALPLPLLSGGDLTSQMGRAARAGRLGAELALAVARPVANALRGLLCDLSQPVVHADLRPSKVLLPGPAARLDELTLIDLDGAGEHAPAGDVRAFGSLLSLMAFGHERPPADARTSNTAFNRLLRGWLADEYASLADRQLWRDLAADR